MQDKVVEYIQERRKELNISVSALSDMADVPKSTLEKLLSGAVTSPSFYTVVSTVAAMDGSLDEALGLHPAHDISAGADGAPVCLPLCSQSAASAEEDRRKLLTLIAGELKVVRREKHALGIALAVAVAWMIIS